MTRLRVDAKYRDETQREVPALHRKRMLRDEEITLLGYRQLGEEGCG